MFNLKKGAMFGLDARIALAIFGALSVISGAALYSAIKDARVVALITEMQEIAKAWESYYLDTGQYPMQLSSDSANVDFYTFKGADLVVDSGVKGWNGPYLQYSLGTGGLANDLMYGKPSAYAIYLTMYTKSVDWTARADGLCSTGRNCFLWVRMSKVKDHALILAIDEKIDGSDGASKGSFRWSGVDGDEDINLAIQAIKNPVD